MALASSGGPPYGCAMKLPSIIAALMCLQGGVACAQDITIGDLTITDPRTFETPPGARAAAAYFAVTNTGDSADALIGVEADFPRVELHESIEDGGVMKMRPVDRLDLAPGATVTLAPGGLHVMIMGLKAPFGAGDEVPLTLVFENAGPRSITLPVREIGAKAD